MIGYAGYEYFTTSKEEIEEDKKKLDKRTTDKKAFVRLFLSIISMLIILDLAGDATEVLTIVFVARFQNVLLVFVSCVVALSAASAVETVIGNRLGKFFSYERIRVFSLLVFAIIGTIIVVTTIVFR